MQTEYTSGRHHDITTPEHPTIRLINATPSESGRSSIDALPPMLQPSEDPWEAAGFPARLAPKPSKEDLERKRRLVPKKSVASSISGRGKHRDNDFSDVVRRVGAPAQSSSSFGGGFEIYVDSRPKSPEQEADEDIAEVVVVRKKKSRMALDGVAWGEPLGEVTNVPPSAAAAEVSRKKSTTLKKKVNRDKENEGGRGSTSGLMKMKSEMDAKDKWWSIGRGRRDLQEVKEEVKEKKKRTKSPGPEEATKGKIKDPNPRSKTPEPLRRAKSSAPEKTLRSRFHSMDFGMMFRNSANENVEPDPPPAELHTPPAAEVLEPSATAAGQEEQEEQATPKAPSTRHSRTSTGHQRQGSIAVRAMKSFQSLARMGSWNQLKRTGMEGYDDPSMEVDHVEETPKEKKVKKDKKSKDKLKDMAEDTPSGEKEKKSKKSSSSKEGKEKSSKSSKSKATSSSSKKKKSMDILSSSAFDPPPQQDDHTVLGSAFEFNPPPSESKDPSLGKRRSILGIGLPSTLSKMTGRLQHGRSGSTASSILATGSDGEPRQPATLSGRASRLSLSSARMLFTHGRSSSRAAFDSSMISRERSGSVMSNYTSGTAGSNGTGGRGGGSTRSSLRPLSVSSSILARAGLDGERRSSGGSVRWDESVLESVKERRDGERVEKDKERVKEDKEKRKEDKEKRREEKEKRKEEKEKRREEKEKKKAEKEKKRSEADESGTTSKKKKSKKDSKKEKSSKSKRTALADIFPAAADDSTIVLAPESALTPTQQTFNRAPVIRKKAATSDGYLMKDTDSVIGQIMEEAIKEEDAEDVTRAPAAPDTPTKKHRRRPMSEQLLGRSRPITLSQESGEGVLTVLDAATNDLAQLISNLDLEATPGTPERTPHRITRTFKLDFNAPPIPRREDSPTRNVAASSPLEESAYTGVKRAPSYITSNNLSLRPYAQSRKNTIGHGSRPSQAIPSWPVPASEERPSKAMSLSSPPALLIGAATSSLLPAAEITPSRVFFPPTSSSADRASTLRASSSKAIFTAGEGTIKALSSKSQPRTSVADVFSRSKTDTSSQDEYPFLRRSPVFRRQDSLSDSSARNSSQYNDSHRSEPSSFMGDIPAELHELLSSQNADDALSFFERASVVGPSSGDAPMLPGSSMANSMMPLDPSIFHAEPIDFEGEETDETKRSFDFTAEIRNLRESSAFEHQSFVEQLANAFGTPAKANYSSVKDRSEVPSLPEIPPFFKPSPRAEDDASICHSDETSSSELGHGNLVDMNMVGVEDDLQADVGKLPFGLSSFASQSQFGNSMRFPDTASLASTEHSEDIMMEDVSVDDHPPRGQLNMSFKFGGIPKVVEPVDADNSDGHPKSLSDIIPPLSHTSPMVGSPLPVPISPIPAAVPRRRVRVSSDSSIHRFSAAMSPEFNPEYRRSRRNSELSFMGFESFDEVRRGFEFGRGQPRFWPPTSNQARFLRPQSGFSISSVSSYGRPHDYGLSDPFGYANLSSGERPLSDAFSILSNTVDDTFAFIHRHPLRSRVESDASSFSFRAPLPGAPSNRDSRRFSAMSGTGHAPPVALVTRGFSGRTRNDSAASIQSRGRPFSGYGSNKRFSWTRHRRDSGDSAMSDFSISRLVRPGLGDKMFDTAANYRMSLASIPASPTCPDELPSIMDRSFQDDTDSVVDHEEQLKSERDDSIFSKSAEHLTNHSVGSVFGGGQTSQEASPHVRFNFRPLSVLSMEERTGPVKENDTMISMFDGGHVPRSSMDSGCGASPCGRIEKRKRSEDAPEDKPFDLASVTPNKARIVEAPGIVEASPFIFGEERMIQAQQGLIKRYSLEESCLVADGEDPSVPYYNAPVFSRPTKVNRSRSSTCTSDSGRETPSLTSAGSDSFSSMDENSSVDLSDLNLALSTIHSQVTAQVPVRNRTRPRGQAHSHSRHSSYARTARSSIYETIEEEILASSASPTKTGLLSTEEVPTTMTMGTNTTTTATTRRPVFLTVDDDAASIHSTRSRASSIWDDDTGVIALRKYYALRTEAESTVSESQQQWLDTQASLFALKAFEPPRHPTEMRALLQESLEAFQPLPSELRPHRVRSRTSSRVSPYPITRPSRPTIQVEEPEPIPPMPTVFSRPAPARKTLLKEVTTKSNLYGSAPSMDGSRLFPMASNPDLKQGRVFSRPRVVSGGRKKQQQQPVEAKSVARVASREFKENIAVGTLTPGDSLKFNRPRPRGRPANGPTAKPIRI